MPPQPNIIEVVVDGPVRGTVNDPNVFGFIASDVTVTSGWGLQPGTAILSWVKSSAEQPDVAPMSGIEIRVGGHVFRGIAKKSTPVTSTDGNVLTQEFEDSRAILQFDQVFGVFNRRHDWIDNGVFYKGYKSLLPQNYNQYAWIYHFSPFTAIEILDFMFDAPTIGVGWNRNYIVPYMDIPIYEIDCEKGKDLGTAVMEVSGKCGATFALAESGRWDLVWTIPGLGDKPTIPADADNIRDGLALSDYPSQIRVLGARNLYQVLDVQMQPDWAMGWMNFFDIEELWYDIFLNEVTDANVAGVPAGTPYTSIAGDTDFIIGKQLASARARVITVGQYAALRDARDGNGNNFRDTRKFQGRSRLQLPAALYIQQILFRCFKLPTNFQLRTFTGDLVPVSGLKIINNSLVEISHNPITGVMSYQNTVQSASNGYAIIQGYQVGSDSYKTLNPDTVNLSQWVSAQDVWQHVVYGVDESGENDLSQFIIFDQPVFRSADLLAIPSIAGTPQSYPALKSLPTFTIPPVRAALCLQAEPFSYYIGDAANQGALTVQQSIRNEVENVSDLNGQYVVSANGGRPTELTFADGSTAFQKAFAIGSALLNLQYVFGLGGYTLPRSAPTFLTSLISRVTVRCNGRNGLKEEIDFTSQRDRNIGPYGLQLEPPRDLERREQLAPLFPGQLDLREQSRKIINDAAFLQANPDIKNYIRNLFYQYYGYDEGISSVIVNGGTGTLGVGTPLFCDGASPRPINPAGATMTNPRFAGVTVLDGENAANNHPVRVSMTGVGGVITVRVKMTDAFTRGTPLGLSANETADDFLSDSPSVQVGTLYDDMSSFPSANFGTIVLARVQVAGGGGGGDGSGGIWL